MLYVETNSLDPFYNLAFEEYLLNCDIDSEILMLWQNEPSVIIGNNQNADEEVNLSFAKENGIHVVRRITGGGAVYHDAGNINYSFIVPVKRTEDISLGYFCGLISNALQTLGIPAEVNGRNDILVNGKKISGTAQRIVGDRILFHGCLLFNSDVEMLSEVLTPNDLKFTSKSTKSVRSRVTNLAAFFGNNITTEDFKKQFKTALNNSLDGNCYVSDDDKKAISDLADKKYRSREWNYGYLPEFNISRKKRFQGGIVEIRANVSDGQLVNINFHGDYMSRKDSLEISQKMRGIRFTYSEVGAVFSEFDLRDYFGDISKEDLLSLIFPEVT